MGPNSSPDDPAASQLVHDLEEATPPEQDSNDAPDNRPKKTPTGAKKPGKGMKKPGTGSEKPRIGEKSSSKDRKNPTTKPHGKIPEKKGNAKRPVDEDPPESSAKKPKLQESIIQPRHDVR